jgi:hypothetical protein
MAEILNFKNFHLSSRGLLARIILPNNQVAYRDDISSISYEVKNITDGLPSETGNLTVADVMFNALQIWNKDDTGFTFGWAFDGDLIPLPDKSYRFVLRFTIRPDHPVVNLQGKSFVVAYQANTRSPLT